MKQIEKYQNQAAYDAAGLPVTASRVAQIDEGNVVKFDGVNVVKATPVFGDPIYTDEQGRRVCIDRHGYTSTLIPDGWTYKGVFIGWYKDGRWRVLLGNYASLPSYKYADVIQHTISAITDTDVTINLKIQDTSKSGNDQYATLIPVNVTLTSAEINATSAAEISEAVAAKAAEMGDTKAWWAYLADDDGNMVQTDGTKIIVQCDTWAHFSQYGSSMTGGTIAFSTWGDMPATSGAYLKANGKTSTTRGIMNFAGAASYWNTHGRALTAHVSVGSESGDPMLLSEFNDSEYAADIRAHYKTYIAYLRGEFGLASPQKLGPFRLQDGEYLTQKYGPMMAPTKAGGTKAKYPALNWAYLQGGHLWGVDDGEIILEDNRLAVINATQAQAGKYTISPASNRWFAQRSGVNVAWYSYGSTRMLTYYSFSVYYAYQVVAVALLSE